MTTAPASRSTLQSRGQEIVLWTWAPPAAAPYSGTALVVVFHGLGAHARFPSVAIVSEALAAAGFVVCAADMPGHGESEGLQGYLRSSEDLVAGAMSVVRAAQAAHTALPLFLLGSSMGGALAMRCSQQLSAEGSRPSGLVMLAPMLAPAASPAITLLVRVLSYTPLAWMALIPSSATDNAKQYADPEVIQRVEQDRLALKGNLRVASVATVLLLGAQCEESLESVDCPFLCLVAEREMVLGQASRAASERLMRVAATPESQRTLMRYDALHGLLCEPEPLRSQIVGDIVAWMRVQGSVSPPA